MQTPAHPPVHGDVYSHVNKADRIGLIYHTGTVAYPTKNVRRPWIVLAYDELDVRMGKLSATLAVLNLHHSMVQV